MAVLVEGHELARYKEPTLLVAMSVVECICWSQNPVVLATGQRYTRLDQVRHTLDRVRSQQAGRSGSSDFVRVGRLPLACCARDTAPPSSRSTWDQAHQGRFLRRAVTLFTLHGNCGRPGPGCGPGSKRLGRPRTLSSIPLRRSPGPPCDRRSLCAPASALAALGIHPCSCSTRRRARCRRGHPPPALASARPWTASPLDRLLAADDTARLVTVANPFQKTHSHQVK